MKLKFRTEGVTEQADFRYSEDGMQPVRATLAVIALLAGFLQAPFWHFHVNGQQHDGASIVHMHATAPQGESVLAQGEQPAVYLDWGGSPAPILQALPVLSSTPFVERPRLSGAAFETSEERPCEPPGLRRFPPRAPPV